MDSIVHSCGLVGTISDDRVTVEEKLKEHFGEI